MKQHAFLRAAACAAAVLLAAACIQESDMETIPTPAGEFPASYFEKGHVRIYVSPDLAAQIEAEGTEGPATRSIDGLGAVQLERTFPHAGKFEKRTREAGLHRWYDVRFDEEIPLTRAVRSFEGLPGILEVEYRPVTLRNYDNTVYALADGTPDATAAAAAPAAESALFDDPMLGRQWHYFNSGAESGTTAGCDINVLPVWKDYTAGRRDVIVAVTDGGIDYMHEDLADNMWTDPERPGEVHGYNFIENSVTITKTSHGTHVAGTIAAVNNNGKGVCGIAGGNHAAGLPGVRLMSCQIFKEDEDSGERGGPAIKWSADHGAVISQNSWGYPTLNYVPKSDMAAIEYFNTYAGFDENGIQVGPMAGGIVIFAAGNENKDFGSPAASEEALSVAALGPDYYRAYYSNYGDWVDVAAPGGDYQKGHQILSTLPDNSYGLMQGTSMACPHVSGIAALIVSQYGGYGFTRAMLWNRIVNTTRDISLQNRNYPVGSGLVDALAAVTAEGTIPPDAVTDFKASLQNADFIRFSLTIPEDEDDRKAYGIHIYYHTEPFTETAMIPYKNFPTEDLQAGDTMEGILSGLAFETTYYLRCEAYDRIGNRSALSEPVIVTTGKNHAPTVQTNDVLDITLRSHERRRLEFRYAEPDGHGIHTKLDKGSDADSLGFLQNWGQHIDINALRAEPGSYSATLHVYDDYEEETTVSYSYTILPNHAPTATGGIENQVFRDKGEIQTVNLSEIFRDEDGETLVYTLNSSDNDILNLHVREGLLYITALRYGYAAATITASDARGASASVSFQTLARDGSKAIDIYPTVIQDGKLYLRPGENLNVRVQVLSESGTPVLEKDMPAAPFQPGILDLSGLPGGLYSVKVLFNGQSVVQNIVVL